MQIILKGERWHIIRSFGKKVCVLFSCLVFANDTLGRCLKGKKKLQLRIRRTCCGTAAVFTLELRKELDWQEASRFVTPGRAGAAMCRANCANKSLHFWEEGGFVSWNPVKMPLHSNLDRSLCCLFIRKPHGPECEQRKSSNPALASRRRDRG